MWRWYAERLAAVEAAEPNEAHLALARLERRKQLTVVTQNVDGLHRRAGSENVIELHGDLTRSRCEGCGQLDPLRTPLTLSPHCSRCGRRSRPDVVWFGERPPSAGLDNAVAAFSTCQLALVVGTSGVVEPAASLAHLALDRGAVVVEVNPEVTSLSAIASVGLRMDAVPGLSALIP